MNCNTNILWLEVLIEDSLLNDFTSVSPASNLWHYGFLQALQNNFCKVYILGHAYEQLWPRGKRLIIKGNDAKIPSLFCGSNIGYINFPFLRKLTQIISYLYFSTKYIFNYKKPHFVFTYNDSSALIVARFFMYFLNIRWVSIVGDGYAPRGADFYVFQNWHSYSIHNSEKPKFFLDGGIPPVNFQKITSELVINKCIFMYMGSLNEHGGIIEFANAFSKIDDSNIELWITGRGINHGLIHLERSDKRIINFGFVDREKLNQLASQVKFFVNPRPNSFVPNKLNYPSKILHYLAYGKPILSTISPGLSPEYKDFLIPLSDENESNMISSIKAACAMSDNDYYVYSNLSKKFAREKEWYSQVSKLLKFLNSSSS